MEKINLKGLEEIVISKGGKAFEDVLRKQKLVLISETINNILGEETTHDSKRKFELALATSKIVIRKIFNEELKILNKKDSNEYSMWVMNEEIAEFTFKRIEFETNRKKDVNGWEEV